MRITDTKTGTNENALFSLKGQGTEATGRSRRRKKQDKAQGKNGRIFAGELAVNNPIEAKRREAQKKALKIVKDAFTKELSIDANVDSLKESARKANEEMFVNQEELNKIRQRREELSQDTMLSEEERTAALRELDEAERHFTRQLQNEKSVENAALMAVEDVSRQRLKSAPMVDAEKAAEETLLNAAKEMAGMVVREAKENLEEEQNKKVAEAEEKEAAEKELEERIEAMRAKDEDREEEDSPAVSALAENTSHLLKTWQVKEGVQKELQGVVTRLKLDLEDLKGAQVDEKV